MKTRDKFKQEKKFPPLFFILTIVFKVTNLVRAAKRAYFKKLINNKKDTSFLWRAMNEITHKSRNKAASCEIKCSPNSLNEHLLNQFLNPQTTVQARIMKSHHFFKSSAKTE